MGLLCEAQVLVHSAQPERLNTLRVLIVISVFSVVEGSWKTAAVQSRDLLP